MAPSVSLPSRTVETSRPRFHMRSRRPPIRSASSENRSTRMARAPSSAAAASGTFSVDVARGRRGRVERRVAEQGVGQRLEPVLPGDHRLGAPLGLVRQVDVLQAGLRVGREDPRLQRGVELALRRGSSRAPRPGAPRARAGSAAAPPACAAGRRRGCRWPPCGSGRRTAPSRRRRAGRRRRRPGRADAELVGDALLDGAGLRGAGAGVLGRGLLWLDLRTCHSPIVAGGARAVTPGSDAIPGRPRESSVCCRESACSCQPRVGTFVAPRVVHRSSGASPRSGAVATRVRPAVRRSQSAARRFEARASQASCTTSASSSRLSSPIRLPAGAPTGAR